MYEGPSNEDIFSGDEKDIQGSKIKRQCTIISPKDMGPPPSCIDILKKYALPAPRSKVQAKNLTGKEFSLADHSRLRSPPSVTDCKINS